MMAVSGAFEATFLPGLEPILAHQSGRPTTPDGQVLILEFARHAWAAIGAIRLSKGGPDMGEQHQIVALTLAGWTTSPGKGPARAHLKNLAQVLDGEFRFRHIDEREPHRLPPWRGLLQDLPLLAQDLVLAAEALELVHDVLIGRRGRRGPGVLVLCHPAASVERFTLRSSAIARWERPLVKTRRTASS